MPFIDIDTGVTLHYEEFGNGRPVVFLHGWCMSSVVWRFQQPLADSVRLLCPDLRGHGKSSLSVGGFTLADLADDIVSFFNLLDLHNALLVGWSLGSQVALQALFALRERLAAVVLVGATPRFTAGEGYSYGLPEQDVRGMEIKVRRDYQRTMGEFFRGMFAPEELTREQENRVAREIVMSGHIPEQEVARAGLKILATSDLRHVLPETDIPTLLVHGDHDVICPPGVATYMAERIPGARLAMLAGMGHAPFLSHPDYFNELLLGFTLSQL